MILATEYKSKRGLRPIRSQILSMGMRDLCLLVVVFLLKPSVAWVRGRRVGGPLGQGIRGRSSSALWGRKEEHRDCEPQTIQNLEELAELQKGNSSGREVGVYHMDAALLEAWKEAGGDVPANADSSSGEDELGGRRREDLQGEQAEAVTYTYEEQRLRNDVTLQAELDLQKVEEAREIMFRRVLGTAPYDTIGPEAPGDHDVDASEYTQASQEAEVEAKLRSRQKPSEEEVQRKQRLMREIAEGMKLNLAKEKKRRKLNE